MGAIGAKNKKSTQTNCPKCLILLVRPARFELATYGFVVRRSIRAELRAHRTIRVLSLTLIFLLVKAVTYLLITFIYFSASY
jgi:hypothetical protein